jgi:Plant transposon protein
MQRCRRYAFRAVMPAVLRQISRHPTATGKRAICSTTHPGAKCFSKAKASIAMGSRVASASAWDEFAAEYYGLRHTIDEDNEAVVFLCCSICLVMTRHVLLKRKRVRESGGSWPGKRSNRDIGRADGAARVDRDYFCRQPEHSNLRPVLEERVFERRYRVPRHFYEDVREKLLNWEDSAIGLFLSQKTDACGSLGASTDQKRWSAFRVLSLGIPADAAVEYSSLAESTNAECLKLFARAIVEIFTTEWLRVMTMDDSKNKAAHYRGLCFPGCIGCRDCASWKWDACPMAWQAQFKGKEKVPTVRMEVITDDFLRVWWLNFGVPGARMTRKLLTRVHSSARFAPAPGRRHAQTSMWRGFPLKRWYFLADWIYRHLRFSLRISRRPRLRR